MAFAQRGERLDEVQVGAARNALELTWNDTEESLKGVIFPVKPVEGEAVRVTVRVGSFQGAAFKGPVTLSVHPEGEAGANAVTVAPVDGSWTASFVPVKPGPHVLDVSFRTTRLKALHARFDVSPGRLPRAVAWIFIGGLVVLALGAGVWRIVRRS